MENNNKYYIVSTNFGTDSLNPSGDVYLYKKYYNAKEKFNKLKKEFIKEFEEKTDYEYDNYTNGIKKPNYIDFFSIWETGEYSVNHAEVKLNEIFIQDQDD